MVVEAVEVGEVVVEPAKAVVLSNKGFGLLCRLLEAGAHWASSAAAEAFF